MKLETNSSNSVQHMSVVGGELFGIGKKLVERGAVEELSANNNRTDLLRVVNVVERVGVEQDEVSVFAGGNRSLGIEASKKFCGIARPRLQCLHRRQAGSQQQSKVLVQTETGKHVRRGGVRSGHKTCTRLSHLPGDCKRAFHNLFAQHQISFRAVFQTLSDSLGPERALVLRNELHQPILRQIRSRRHESEMHENGKRRNLPSVIGGKNPEETRGFFWRVRIEKSLLPRARACEGSLGSFVQRTGSELFFTEPFLLGRARKQNAGKMFDARLSGLRRLERGHSVRDMADKANSLLFTFFCDGKVCVAINTGLLFFEINAFARHQIVGGPRFVTVING